MKAFVERSITEDRQEPFSKREKEGSENNPSCHKKTKDGIDSGRMFRGINGLPWKSIKKRRTYKRETGTEGNSNCSRRTLRGDC